MQTIDTLDAAESDIAIIGMSGRFPGAMNLEEFWGNLRDGKECIKRYTDEELRAARVPENVLSDPRYVKAAALLEDADLFDAEFFGFTPREAEILDPQQRVLLECAWEAIERAGYAPSAVGGAVGVYVGGTLSTYLLKYLYPNREMLEEAGILQVLLSNDLNFLATRVSYKLNLQGPSMTVQTACSTSLVAVHLACQALLGGECDLALAGGVGIKDYEKGGYYYQPGGLLSADGRCRAFDARATGTVSGNGVGIVVLKRLKEALAEGDQIHAVIKGSAINNDGGLKVGYSAPRVESQASVISEALNVAGIRSETIGYVETHGSGTELGDPIEVTALNEAFGECEGRHQFCAIGSLKTSVGHLDAAAGVGGLIKTVLALRHAELPPSLHYEQSNPKIHFENSPFYVNTQLQPWPSREGQHRRAGVSSFGIGGTNAHVVLEEAPHRPPEKVIDLTVELVPLSARTPAALTRAKQQLAGHLKQDSDRLVDVAWTLQAGRREFKHREALICRNLEEAVQALEGNRPTAVISGRALEMSRRVSFLFPGVGDHYPGMAKGLFVAGGVFSEELQRCSALFASETGHDVLAELFRDFNGETNTSRADNQVSGQMRRWLRGDESPVRTLDGIKGQAALFTVDYALAQMWIQWGVKPKAVLGYSLGEYVAACVAGVLSLEDAVRVVAIRERLIETAPVGAMVTVGLGVQELEDQLMGQLDVAIDCSPGVCVVGGPVEEVETFVKTLTARGVVWRRQQGSFAVHTRMMKHLASKLEHQIRSVSLREPKSEYISNVTGRRVGHGELTQPGYWAIHLWQRVRFREALSELLQDREVALLETGPAQTLGSFAQQSALSEGKEALVVASVRNNHEDIDDQEFVRRSIGKLWVNGVKIDWKQIHNGQSRRRVELPTYPFERKRFWVSGGLGSQKDKLWGVGKVANEDDWLYVPVWKRAAQPPREKAPDPDEAGRWLVFAEGSLLAHYIIDHLRQRSGQVTVVHRGERFQESSGTYTIDSTSRQDYSLLLASLRKRGDLPEKIVFLWNTDRTDRDNHADLALPVKTHDGFFSLFFLAQALGEINFSRELGLFVISNHSERIDERDAVDPEKSLVKGPCRALPQEYANRKCRHIDIDWPVQDEESAATIAARLLCEIRSEANDEFVALRGRYRWVPDFARFNPGVEGGQTFLRDEGVYLVTGGLGGIGLTLAGYLAAAVKAKLVLTGWRALPQRAEWEQWVSEHGEDDETSRRILRVAELEAAGAQVLVLEADVSDLKRMQEVISNVHSRFGRIDGVIHTAGVTGGGMMQTREEVEKVLRAKVEGTQVLASVVEDDHPDFMVFCSSLGSLLGGVGQADYYAANAYQDAFAQHGWAQGKKIISINWDVWQEVGMAMRTHVTGIVQRLRDEWIQQGITPAEGARVFARILAGDEAQVAVSTQNLEERIKRQQKTSGKDFRDQLDQIEFELDRKGREGLSSEWVGARNPLESRLTQVWERVLGIAGIGIHDNFFELGGNSLMGIQLLSRLREATGTELPLSMLFASPTIAQLSEIVDLGNENSTSEPSERIKKADREEDILRMVGQMSEEEVEKALAELE